MRRVRRSITVLAAFALTIWATPAAAEWRRAESEHFIVYSDGRESALRDYVETLETFDHILRLILPVKEGPIRKLPIFLVGGRQALFSVHPYLPRYAGGAYIASAEDIFAVAIRNIDEDIILHEYMHHYMLQNFDGAFPGWLVEGFAEYYAATEIEDDHAVLGGFNMGRVGALAQGGWISIEELLTLRGDQVRSADRYTYYPVAWLMTHWFLGDERRRGQLQAYLDELGRGTPSVEAMRRATGMTPDQIRRALSDYFSGRVPQARLNRDFPDPVIEVTRLGPAADDLLLLNQRLRIGTPEADRAEVVAQVRRRAERHGDDPLALLALGHAELHFGDGEVGAALLLRLLEREPEHVEALQLMATHFFREARERPEERVALINQGRSYLARAYQVEPDDYYTLMLLGQSREGVPGYPTENDLQTWLQAFELAPQLSNTRLGLARTLMQAERNDEAIVILPPLANAPHGGPAAEAAQLLLAQARAGLAPLSQEEIDAASERQAQEAPTPPEPDQPTGEDDEAPQDEPEVDAPQPGPEAQPAPST